MIAQPASVFRPCADDYSFPEEELFERVHKLQANLHELETVYASAIEELNSRISRFHDGFWKSFQSLNNRVRFLEDPVKAAGSSVKEIDFKSIQDDYRGSGRIGFDAIGSGLVPSSEGNEWAEFQFADEHGCIHTVQIPPKLLAFLKPHTPVSVQMTLTYLKSEHDEENLDDVQF